MEGINKPAEEAKENLNQNILSNSTSGGSLALEKDEANCHIASSSEHVSTSANIQMAINSSISTPERENASETSALEANRYTNIDIVVQN